ncbi:MAG: DUF1570 domain-containing protein [Pirellulaceae bacterium]
MQRWATITAISCTALACCAAAGCVRSSLLVFPHTKEMQREVEYEQLVFHGYILLSPSFLNELKVEREEMSDTLKLPSSDRPIHVYLFGDEARYRDYVRRHFPEFPKRRAFFIENEGRLSVYAYESRLLQADLRHELAHAYLHAAVSNLPLWLDEGLAEYFEVPPGPPEEKGLHRPHVDLLRSQARRGQWSPSLTRLEKLSEAGEMSQTDYAEAWAWTHWMLHTSPARRELLQGHLTRLHDEGEAGPLSAQIDRTEPSPESALLRHLETLSDRE